MKAKIFGVAVAAKRSNVAIPHIIVRAEKSFKEAKRKLKAYGKKKKIEIIIPLKPSEREDIGGGEY